jgi:L-ascorbate metabolism protein UlaG (beta-lactamase superfamily)
MLRSLPLGGGLLYRMPSFELNRRRLLSTAAAVPAAALAMPGRAAAEATVTDRDVGCATFRWLGTAGWRIDIGTRTVLVDPYLSRFDTGLFRGAFNPATPLSVNTAVVDANAGRPENIFVTHTHWDHVNDVPHIATASGARVFGTLTGYNLNVALHVPTTQLSVVKGGEVLDFGDYSVEVIASLHSRNAAYAVAFPGVRITPPPTPATIADLPEGDTLAYQIAIRNGPKVFFMGGSDFVARNLVGLRPDVAMVALNSSTATYDYVGRLMAALDRPAVVVPVHWDNFEVPLQNPPTVGPADKARLDQLVAAVHKTSPRTRVMIPQYLTDYHF